MENASVPILHQLFSARLMERFKTECQSLSQVRVLDLGCGRGEQLVYMKRIGFQMSGCDISKEHIKSTMEALTATDGAPTDVRLSKTSELPFESGQFHAVYSNGVFEHCAEMPPLIAEASRVLIPGGMLLTAFPLRSVVVEPHLKFPFVHWFSMGRSQRLLIRVLTKCYPKRNCHQVERFLRDEVFYWTVAQARQILHRHFDTIHSLSKEYIMIARNQVTRNLFLRLGLSATQSPLISSFVESLLSSQWTFIAEAHNSVKRKA